MCAQIINFKSIKEWKDYCFKTHSSYLKNVHFRKWINKKEIFIFNFSNLGKEKIKHIKSGIEDAIKAARLHFNISYRNDGNAQKIINSKNKRINSAKLLKMIIKQRKEDKAENAYILIFNNPIKSSDAIIHDGGALTYVSEGVTLFTFSALKKYPNNFLRCRAKHEAIHLLGLNSHHEDTKVKGYDYGAYCVMRYNAPTMDLCRKCKDALTYFWKGMEYATKRQFIKG